MPCLIVSIAFEKSNRRRTDANPLSRLNRMSLVTFNKAVAVLWFERNPDWNSWGRPNSAMKSLTWLFISLSRALEVADSILIGLKSSIERLRVFLCRGMTFDNFHCSGKHDLSRAALKIAVIEGRITGKSSLTNEIGILSSPSEFDLILRIASQILRSRWQIETRIP